MPKTLIKSLFFIAFLMPFCLRVSAQVPLLLNDEENQRFFTFNEIQALPDSTALLTFGQVLSKQYTQKFRPSELSSPKTGESGWAYWYRIRISNTNNTRKNWLLEFMDQTIDSITVYSPRKEGGYTKTSFGAAYHFDERLYHHKNFTHNISSDLHGTQTYYIRIVSHQPVNVIVVLRSVSWFIHYALDEYLFFGAFYGMLTVFGLYNLMMFFAIRQKQYLYYVMYNVSIGFYEMCTDGIAYQYVWPNSPHWNQYAYGIALYFASVSGMLFTLSLLHVKARAPQMYKIFVWAIALRSVFFLCCLLIDKSWFNYKIIEIVPLLLACYTGFYVMRKGYWPARFFVVGYSFLFVGFIIKILIALDVPWLPFGPVTHYSLSFCFIMEMLFISFAIAEKVRALKKKKDYVQRRIIRQMKQNEELKDNINRQLEHQVQERTRELSVKSEVIEQQNDELKAMNLLLKEQSEEISRINVLLEKDNITLHNDIEKVTHDRVMSAEVDFEEFSRIYPDRETCFGFLAKLKWERGYACRRCEHTHYSGGHLPYSRRCSKCGYEESVIAYTILQNTRIPINKAFYMIFLMYSTKGKISSHKLSEVLDIRQSTCWAYSSRIKKVMETKKKELRNAGHKGWSKLVIDVDDD
ncbi:chromosome partitioning protein ParA [Mucilaginibacter roseus]|uniref:Chromosome partitioning protein ParA n=1 Tax=Mucilaginibacter roseus TaxID=1528868 RepID=A0ABS8U0D4_9SPHI|nr:7TM diverse intracellular signaling domain-containing protein [Mucilaginibacter roseus]MCD8739209.1 chromosome partitioning protein ParA [Mucilaginibacter roseus]